jgi:adenylate kinase family enzyme
MTRTELNHILIERKRLAAAYQSLITSRNIAIDILDKEYERHVKLNKKSENPHAALLSSLSKSRNIKRFQKELMQIKNLIKENQAQAKKLKVYYNKSKLQYDFDLYHQLV